MDVKEIKVKAGEIREMAWVLEGMSCGKVRDGIERIRRHADAILHFLEEQEEEVHVYDDGGMSFDRYTVFVGSDVYTMSSHPLNPLGMNQWAGKASDFEGPDGFKIGSRLLGEDEVPPEVREAIELRKVQALAPEVSDAGS